MEVYQYAGVNLTSDPRRTDEYREKVLEAVNFGKNVVKEDLTEHDVEAIREVLRRKAAAFWVEGSPRTTVRNLMHLVT